MDRCCPTCGRPFADMPLRTAQLYASCLLMGIEPTGDGYVSEAAAARLIGRKAKTLHNKRHAEGGIPYRKAPGRSGRVEYALDDLADYIAGSRKNGDSV